jgi:hypothetical protein
MFETDLGKTEGRIETDQEQSSAQIETDLDANPGETEAAVERQEVPKKEPAVRSSGTMKKRHRGRHIAAGRRGKPRKLTR